MSMRNYWSEQEGPQPTADEELHTRGRRSLLGIVCAPLTVVVLLWAMSALLP